MQLAASPAVQLVIIDGKGSHDYADWADRAWMYTGDELPAAAAVLEDVHALMRSRFGFVLGQTGYRNAWHAGPSPAFPLIVTVIDECHGFFDLELAKADRSADKHIRTCRALAGQLVKKGRSVMMLTVLLTQKQTGDAIPTAIRDNAAIGLSFAVRTKEAAVAASVTTSASTRRTARPPCRTRPTSAWRPRACAPAMTRSSGSGCRRYHRTRPPTVPRRRRTCARTRCCPASARSRPPTSPRPEPGS